ncbi:hypothetical protein [Staphylococcus xylosus]|uniref:hypothetical protein n=1 Tax=Staphylococcus xylosus TaxID=1288 RepID=UPI000D1D550E|nr:hypothetical protein [Staphylococcus xylosus]PTI64195.1 hypothetical protein BU095_06255 [Staphylococcus xylosus]
MKRVIHINGKNYIITALDIRAMKENYINLPTFKKRIMLGWTMEQAVNVPKNMRLKTYLQIQKDKEKISPYELYKLEKLYALKPHLKNVKQPPYERSYYTKKLMNENIFAKVKTDIYGNVQLL